MHQPTIAYSYLTTWFWIDFPASLPLELVERYAEIDLSVSKTILPLLRVIRLLKLLRLLRLLRIAENIQKLEDMTGFNLKAIRLINTVLFLLLFCHVLACIFYAVAIATEPYEEKTWVSAFDEGVLVNEPAVPKIDAYAPTIPPLVTCHALHTSIDHVSSPPHCSWPHGIPSPPA